MVSVLASVVSMSASWASKGHWLEASSVLNLSWSLVFTLLSPALPDLDRNKDSHYKFWTAFHRKQFWALESFSSSNHQSHSFGSNRQFKLGYKSILCHVIGLWSFPRPTNSPPPTPCLLALYPWSFSRWAHLIGWFPAGGGNFSSSGIRTCNL